MGTPTLPGNFEIAPGHRVRKWTGLALNEADSGIGSAHPQPLHPTGKAPDRFREWRESQNELLCSARH